MQRYQGFSLLAALGVVFFVGCTEEEQPQVELTVVSVSEAITAPTTWVSTSLYVIENSIPVTAELTIEPGTIVKLAEGVSINVDAGGSIVADAASATTPCVFTSIKDDSFGGDTNADGEATAPAPGDWGYVQVRADGSVFNYCQFLYGGANMPYTGTLLLNGCSATVTHCTFAHNQGGKPTDLRAATLYAGSAGAATVITGNVFFDNDLPLVISGEFGVDGSNVFHGTVGDQTVTNEYNGIFWDGNYDLHGDLSWSNTEVPYVVLDPLHVAEGATLTLADGVIVKLGQRIETTGALIADGEAGILFTSFLDDSAGGDTNGDADATVPAPGDWGYIKVGGDGSRFDHCRFSYGGAARPYTGAFTVQFDSAVTITNSTFSYNAGGTLTDDRAATLNLGSAAAGSVITGNVFYGNDIPLVINGLVSVDDTNVFHSGDATPIGNTYNGIFMDGVAHVVTGDVAWSNTEVPYVMIDGTVLTIATSGSLTLADGVTVKVHGGRIDVSGTLTQGTDNVFTSLHDDTYAGDTDGDGGATAPVKGDWAGVNLCFGSCQYADWGNIFYATNP